MRISLAIGVNTAARRVRGHMDQYWVLSMRCVNRGASLSVEGLAGSAHGVSRDEATRRLAPDSAPRRGAPAGSLVGVLLVALG